MPPATVRELLTAVGLLQYVAAFEEEDMDVEVMREVPTQSKHYIVSDHHIECTQRP